MAKFTCLLPGKELPDVKEDFRAAQKLEQYRLGEKALYLPRGFSWEYIPRSEIRRAEGSRRVITAGHCVTVREEKPAVDLTTDRGVFTLNLEKRSSAETVLAALGNQKGDKT